MKVRRVEFVHTCAQSYFTPSQISGLSEEATLRTVAYVVGVLLGFPDSSGWRPLWARSFRGSALGSFEPQAGVADILPD